MRKLLLTLMSVVVLAASTHAQKISGFVKDQQGKGLEKTTISLLRSKDSSTVKLVLSDDKGFYSFNATAGQYLIKATHTGNLPKYSNQIEVSGSGDVTVADLGLEISSKNLSAVTVVAQRPIVEVKADKTILNVEGTINAVGSDALELLRKAPGVMIDKDDNISLAGKNGVAVYIDGKPSPLAGSDLTNFLKSTQSAQIESIELITNPSAKYEAAGNAGIINIRLKKNKAFGTNGSANLGFTQGVYAKYNAGINLNHRNKNINVFGSYNYNNGDYLMKINGKRTSFDTLFDQRNRIIFSNNTHSFKAGADYTIDKLNTIGVVLNGNIAKNNVSTGGPMDFIYVPTNELVKVLYATNANDMKRNNMNTNLNYRYSKSGGTDLSIDADYGFFTIRSNQFQPNYYFNAAGTTEIDRVVNRMISPTNIDLYSVKADYETNAKGGRLGLGGKIGFVETDNDFKRYDVKNNSDVYDSSRSNRFKYKENVNAIYANYNKQLKAGVLFQLGLRIENTHADGHSTGFKQMGSSKVPYDSTFDRNYTDFFPSASLTFNKNPMSQFTVSYSRRIDRPAYQDLNPFEFKLNEYTFMKGNTELQPQYTNSFGVTHIFKYKLTTSINYSRVNDIFAQLPDTIDKTKGFLTKKNLANQDVVALSISYPFQYKWYSFFTSFNSNYSHYKASFGGGDRNIDLKVFSTTLYMQNSFRFGKGWTGELTGLYLSPSVWQGTIKSVAMGSVDIGLQKSLFKNKGTLKLSWADILRTMKWGGTSNFAGVQGNFNGNGELQQVKVNFSWRFGSNTVKAANQRKSAIEEEKKRAEGGGGMGQP